MYGGYQNLTDDRHPVYFSPKLDYFWFDPGFTEVMFPYPDALKELIPKLGELQNIMVYPNWHPFQTPRKHEALFEVPSIRQVLVVVDETRISPHIDELLETAKEFKSYYAALQKQEEATKTPYIAAGCLGWIGEAPKRVQRGNEGNRQLVAVFEEKWEIFSHIHRLKQEEVQVTRSLRQGEEDRCLRRPTNLHEHRCVSSEEGESLRKFDDSFK